MTAENPTPLSEASDANEQMRVRQEKRQKLLELGMEAYPVGVERTHSLGEIGEK